MHAVSADGTGQTLGTVMVTPTDEGASFLVQLQGLPAGEHGFHVHAMGDCGPGNNAEGHMAAAMGAPLVSVLGPTDPARWAAVGPAVRIVRKPGGWPTLDDVLAQVRPLLAAR